MFIFRDISIFVIFGTLGARPAMGGGTRPKLRFSRISRALRPQSPPKLHGRWGMVVGGSRESLVHGGALGRVPATRKVAILGHQLNLARPDGRK